MAICLGAEGLLGAEPFAGIHVSALTGLPDGLSVSLSFIALRPLEVEAGASLVMPGYYIRGGWGATVSDVKQADGVRRTVHFAGLGGYRYMDTLGFGENEQRHGRGGSLAAQLQFVRWRRSTVGRELQLTMGAMLFEDGFFFPDLRFAFGVVF
jgi:hypothetical protein